MADKKKKIKKLLFISSRDPFSGRFSGDVIRAKKFTNFFEKKYLTTLVSLGKSDSEKKIRKLNVITFKDRNIFMKLMYILNSFFKFHPFQLGYFYSDKMDSYIKENFKNFDVVFCQSIRTAQYAMSIDERKKILDMGDLYSKNYIQTYKNTFFLNPLKYIYLIESFLMRKYETNCFNNFQEVFLYSKKNIVAKNKITKIDFGIDKVFNRLNYKNNNNRIIFVGNIKYLPNKLACKYFLKKIFPKILNIDPSIEFHIIGEISNFNKFFWSKRKSVKIHGKVGKLLPIIKKSFCALANLSISPAPNTKILTYMSYGIPCIASKQVADNFHTKNKNLLPFYKSDNELIKLIFKLKKNKKYSEKISKNSSLFVRKFKWENILKKINI